MIVELTSATGSQRNALNQAGLSRSTWYYRHTPRPQVATPVAHRDRNYPSRITQRARARIAELIQAAWKAGDSVDHAFATAWDRGLMLGSRRSWWRIAQEINQQDRPVVPRKAGGSGRPGRRPAPVVVITEPNQVWSWDITELKSPYSRKVYKAYSVIDIYSRMIIAWRVEDRENKLLVDQMFREAIARFGAPEVVHADNGSVMTSHDLAHLLADHGVEMTHNRPYVSNDNPYSEAEFRTMKYRPDYPGEFSSCEQARAFLGEYVPWYNTSHKHTGVELFSPQDVFDGTWTQKWQVRDTALQLYYQAHPERFRAQPKTRRPETLVGINHKEKVPA